MHTRTTRQQRTNWSVLIFLPILAIGILIGAVIFGARDATRQPEPTNPASSLVRGSSATRQAPASTVESSEASLPEEVEASVVASTSSDEMNLEQVLAGDFSSLVGTWVDGNGRRLTFDENGLLPSIGTMEGMSWEYDGILKAYIYFTDGAGATIYLLPQGVPYPTVRVEEDGQEFADASNHAADRLLISHTTIAAGEASNFLYRQ